MYTPLQEAIDQRENQEALDFSCQHNETEEVELIDHQNDEIVIARQCVKCQFEILI
jgi:hypothetical protein